MDETVIQLFELNQKTLIQWFQRRQKDPEMSVLTQGLTPLDPIAVADTQLPLPREKLDEAPSTSGPKHQFVFPPNKEGQAPLLRPGRKSASATTTVCSFLPDATTVCSFPLAPTTVCPIAPTPTTVCHIAPAPTMVCPVTPTFTTARPISPASTTVRPIAPAPTTVRPIVSAPTTVCSFPPTLSTVCPIAPPPIAPGVMQPISGPESLFGTLVFNPDMSVSMVIPSFAAPTSSAVPASPAPAVPPPAPAPPAVPPPAPAVPPPAPALQMANP
nr:vegetative cell wall protein gp1-like [Danio rerio]|eukprot:XP_021331390.1 vegetative cell wall protein gp1-like [Danio rerio]